MSDLSYFRSNFVSTQQWIWGIIFSKKTTSSSEHPVRWHGLCDDDDDDSEVLLSQWRVERRCWFRLHTHTHTHRLWLTQRRGGDAGWGQQQGEAEERLTARAQPWNTATNTHWKTTGATERGFISRRRGYDFCDPPRQREHPSPLILRWKNWHRL